MTTDIKIKPQLFIDEDNVNITQNTVKLYYWRLNTLRTLYLCTTAIVLLTFTCLFTYISTQNPRCADWSETNDMQCNIITKNVSNDLQKYNYGQCDQNTKCFCYSTNNPFDILCYSELPNKVNSMLFGWTFGSFVIIYMLTIIIFYFSFFPPSNNDD